MIIVDGLTVIVRKMIKMVTRHKTLIKGEGKYLEFLVYIPELGEWGTCSTPELYPETATMESFKKFYPNTNFDDVRLITLESKIVPDKVV